MHGAQDSNADLDSQSRSVVHLAAALAAETIDTLPGAALKREALLLN